MLSQDMRNLAVAVAALGQDVETVTISTAHLLRIALALSDCADRVAELEKLPVPAAARFDPYPRRRPEGANVLPFSRPWGGHPPGADKGRNPPGGDAA